MAQSDENTLTTGQTDPGACPHGRSGHIFQGCIAYINSYIDIRAKQLYAKIKEYVLKVVGKYNGPWSHIVLTDENSPDTKYRVFIKDGSLRSREMQEYEDNHETDALYERLQKVTANVTDMREATGLMEGDVAEIDAQITTLEGNVSELDARITTLNASVNSIQRTVNNMGVDVRTMGRSVDSLESRVAEIERSEGGLDPTMYVKTVVFDSTMSRINVSLIGINNQITGLNTNQAQITASVQMFNSQTNELASQISGIESRVSALEDGSGGGSADPQLYNRVESLESESRLAAASISALTTRVGSIGASVSNLASGVTDLNTKSIPALRASISDVEARVSTLESQSGGGGGEGGDQQQDFSDQIDALSQEVDAIRSAVDNLPEIASDSMARLKFRILGLDEYSQLAEKDSNTIYFIVDEQS